MPRRSVPLAVVAMVSTSSVMEPLTPFGRGLDQLTGENRVVVVSVGPWQDGGNGGNQVIGLVSEDRDRGGADQRDPGDQQTVFNQPLALLVTNQPTEKASAIGIPSSQEELKENGRDLATIHTDSSESERRISSRRAIAYRK